MDRLFVVAEVKQRVGSIEVTIAEDLQIDGSPAAFLLISQALERTGRNKNRAAQLLGLNRTTLVEMLKRKGL